MKSDEFPLGLQSHQRVNILGPNHGYAKILHELHYKLLEKSVCFLASDS